MKNQIINQTILPTCDSCNKTAQYESVKTVEPGPFAILWEVGGDKALGLIKVDQPQCHLQYYCKDHVPKLEPQKIMWRKDYTGEQDPQKVVQADAMIKQELDRAANTVGEKNGAILTIEHGYEIGKMGIEPKHIQPIVEAVSTIYDKAAVIITEDGKTHYNIGFNPDYIEPVRKAIIDIDERVSVVMRERNNDTEQKSMETLAEKEPNIAVLNESASIVDLFNVCPEAITPIWDAIWDMCRPVKIAMQHGEEVVKTQVNPRDMKQVMDAIIKICSH